MAITLIRKNQLHPDIADLISGYGDSFFTTPVEAQNLVDNSFNSAVRITGNQTINGIKTFSSRPFFNGVGLATTGEAGGGGGEYIFPSNLTVTLSNGKTFGKYGNGETIPAAGKTTSEILQLAISETIPPTIYLNTTPTKILLGEINISNVLSRSYTINNPGASISSASLKWRRGGAGNWTVLNTSTSNNSSYLHTFTNTVNNSNSIDYEYTVIDSQNTTGIAYASALFLYGNYFGYSSLTSLTSITQIQNLGNQILSDGKSRTVSSVTAGAGLYTYYAYKASAGDLTSIVQDGATTIFINGEGAFTKQSDIIGTNLNGASVTYRVYRSNAPQAFTNNTLAFS